MPKPNQLSKARVVFKAAQLTPEEKFAKLGPIARRWGRVPKGTVLPETQVVACPRVKVKDLPPLHIPLKYIEGLEQNQLIKSCCRHPENHEIEGRKSHPDEPIPDIYIFYCDKCGAKHPRFMVGVGDERPMWGCE